MASTAPGFACSYCGKANTNMAWDVSTKEFFKGDPVRIQDGFGNGNWKYVCPSCAAVCYPGKVKESWNSPDVNAFLKDLSELTKRYGIEISGCGCCGSPSLSTVDRRFEYIGDNLTFEKGEYTVDALT